MSVTLEQCVLLRERHALGQQHFSTALDCMRRFVFTPSSPSSSSLASFGFAPQNVFSFFSVFLISFPSLFTLSDVSSCLLCFLSSSLLESLHLLFSFITHSSSSCSSSRSRLSWGQMLGCYTHSGLTVSGLEPEEQTSDLQGSRRPQCLTPKAPRRHLYPVAFLLVTSHLLVLWLILSLVILLTKYQQ